MDSVFIDHPLVQDTVILHDSLRPFRIFDTLFFPFSPDSAATFLSLNGPKFTNSFEFDSIFLEVFEGFHTIVAIQGKHVENDGTHPFLSDAPAWIEASFMWPSYNGFDFYKDSCCTTAFIRSHRNGVPQYLSVVASPDSTIPESTFSFQVGLVNDFGGGDTLNIQTTVRRRP